jgi:hypothetical protein
VKRAHDLSELAEGAAYCRAFGHQWTAPHKKAFGGRGRKAGWAVTLHCPMCGTEKHFQLSRRGELTAPRYVYPDRYLASFFIGAEERARFRLEALDLPVESSLRVIEGGKAGQAS